MSDVFISYSRQDREFVGKLRESLAEQGQDVWIDWESIPPSQAWWDEIKKGIAKANNFVVILSSNSMSSPICHMEIEYARQVGKRIIPVIYEDYERDEVITNMSKRLANPDQDAARKLWGTRQPYDIYDANDSELKHINYFFFRHDDNFESRFAELIEVIQTDYQHKEFHTNLQLRAQEWQDQDRNPSFLLIFDELVSAQKWIQNAAGKSPPPTDLQREYIEASDRRTKQLNRIRQASIIGSAVSIIAIVLLIIAFIVGARATDNLNGANTQIVEADNQLENANNFQSTVQFEATYFAAQQNRAQIQLLGAGAIPTRAVTLAPIEFFATETQIAELNNWEPVTQIFNGAEMVMVPAGCFLMGSTADTDEQPVNEICFDEPFWIDKYEVTNSDFGSEGCKNHSSQADQPRICITWFDARDYCFARGARLPTEPEWEYAARGPDSMIYPWGNEFDGNRLVYEDSPQYGDEETAPVGSRPEGASWVGAMDMAGNVSEWVSTIYAYDQDNDYNFDDSGDIVYSYPYDGEDGRELDSDEPTYIRIDRGGSFSSSEDFSRSSDRKNFRPSYEINLIGFRCALSN